MTLLLLSALLTMATDSRGDILTDLSRGVTKEVVAVKQPVLETAVYVGNTQCTNVKKLFGLEYDQLKSNDKEPDLDQLSLKYVTPSLNVSININDVARLLPKSPAFNREQFVIYAHGFTDDPTKQSFQNISNGFIKRGVYNILALDGSSLIKWLYLRSTTYVRYIGQKLAGVLAQLVNDGLPPESIHIVGHSLGAHISGFTGKHFTELTGFKVARISALDPAGPCFAQLDPNLKIKATDAHFVDVIHSNGGVAGLKEPVGQVDFYPNKGEQQPDCLLDTCSHSRAWLYFGESLINDKAFPAVKCASWDAFKGGKCDTAVSYMGIGAQPGTKGSYYLQTRGQWPFSLGASGTVYKNTEGYLNTIKSYIL